MEQNFLAHNNITSLAEEYILLIKNVLLGLNRIDVDHYKPLIEKEDSIFECRRIKQSLDNRKEGKDWPVDAESMIGLKRMDNIEFCVKDVLNNNIHGDFIETGVWRGGSCIFMRAILKAYDVKNRIVWVADSFEGLPKPDENNYPEDIGDKHYMQKDLIAKEDDVKRNFQKYNLLDNQVRFLKGWFKDTMPEAPIKQLSLIRLDGDMYESTIDVLIYLYPKLSIGGYCIIDDWGAISSCKKAVEDYRLVNNIHEPINIVDWTGVYWKKEKEVNSFNRESFFELLEKKRKIQHTESIKKFLTLNKLFCYEGKDLFSNGFVIKNIENSKLDNDLLLISSKLPSIKIHFPLIKLKNVNTLSFYFDITVYSNTKAKFLYLTSNNCKFDNKQSVGFSLNAGRQIMCFSISEPNLIGQYRLDLTSVFCKYAIHKIEIRDGAI